MNEIVSIINDRPSILHGFNDNENEVLKNRKTP